jgi:hypothetical protein
MSLISKTSKMKIVYCISMILTLCAKFLTVADCGCCIDTVFRKEQILLPDAEPVLLR